MYIHYRTLLFRNLQRGRGTNVEFERVWWGFIQLYCAVPTGKLTFKRGGGRGECPTLFK